MQTTDELLFESFQFLRSMRLVVEGSAGIGNAIAQGVGYQWPKRSCLRTLYRIVPHLAVNTARLLCPESGGILGVTVGIRAGDSLCSHSSLSIVCRSWKTLRLYDRVRLFNGRQRMILCVGPEHAFESARPVPRESSQQGLFTHQKATCTAK